MAHSPREPWPFALSISHPPYPHIRIYSYTCRIVRPPPLLRHRVAYWLAKLLAKYRSFPSSSREATLTHIAMASTPSTLVFVCFLRTRARWAHARAMSGVMSVVTHRTWAASS